ncbi:helix-turn-helix domain-containing protein [Peribacillus muralis]|uniref:helix-turn-helix domain-containing protein n=1 Tax=Peribacillus muralis TaxID=264697 RepID=UPI003CFD9D64
MLTKFEQREFVKRTPKLATRIFQDQDDSILLFKVLANYVEKTNINSLALGNLSETVLDEPEKMKQYVTLILRHMANVAVEESEFAPSYTTGQLAKYFGVSITTINNWIKEGRFQGVERKESNKQVRISANTLWKSRNGKLHPVSKIVQAWEGEQAEQGENLSDTNEIAFLINQMAVYEDKYGGDFEQKLGGRTDLTPEEETDAAAWKYLMKRFNDLNVNRTSKN